MYLLMFKYVYISNKYFYEESLSVTVNTMLELAK